MKRNSFSYFSLRRLVQLIQTGLIYGVDVLQHWEESSTMTVREHIMYDRHKEIKDYYFNRPKLTIISELDRSDGKVRTQIFWQYSFLYSLGMRLSLSST